MEAKCKKCEGSFPRQDILVTQGGLYCEACLPEDAKNFVFSFTISWVGINALLDYIDGDRDIEILMIIDALNESLKRNIITRIRGVIGGDIQEPD